MPYKISSVILEIKVVFMICATRYPAVFMIGEMFVMSRIWVSLEEFELISQLDCGNRDKQ